MPDAIIEVRAAGKTFPNGTRALEALDLEVRAGEFVTLIGPSGCGKSTLLRMVAGLIEPTRGTVRVERRPVFVFQSPTLMPWARLRPNVRLPLDLARVERAASEPRVSQALEQVGLSGFDRHFPRELSGGMQMRASIARALVTEPELLLMDEPFGALDEITRNALDGELLALRARRAMTVLFVTHSIYEAVFLSSRVLVMSARPGRLLRDVAVDEPYPRDDAFRVSPRFLACCKALSDGLAEASRP